MVLRIYANTVIDLIYETAFSCSAIIAAISSTLFAELTSEASLAYRALYFSKSILSYFISENFILISPFGFSCKKQGVYTLIIFAI